MFLTSASAQNGYICSYKFQYKADTVNNKYSKAEEFYLIGDAGQSTFLPLNRYLADSIKQKNNNDNSTLAGEILHLNVSSIPHYKSTIYIVKDHLKKEMLSFKRYGQQNYYSQEDIKLNWVITGDTIFNAKQNRILHKATVAYGGRNYTAWFAPDIPISDGPYKFSGLPGLIISLKDDDSRYLFLLDKMMPYQDKKLPLSPKAVSIKLSNKELSKIDQTEITLESLGVEIISTNGESSNPFKNSKITLDRFIELY